MSDKFEAVTTYEFCELGCGCGAVFSGRGTRGVKAAQKAFDAHECDGRLVASDDTVMFPKCSTGADVPGGGAA